MRTQPPQPRALRGLKVLVGIMAVLIVLGTALVVVVIIQRIYARAAAPSITAASATAPAPALPPGTLPPLALPLALPAGTHIAGIAAAGGVVAVWVTGAAGGQLWLINPVTGAATRAVTAPP